MRFTSLFVAGKQACLCLIVYGKERNVDMDIKITPQKLTGKVSIPSSKSITHRALICAALAKGNSVLNGISFSDDINATVSALEQLGAKFEIDTNKITVHGITQLPKTAEIDCLESGSTLRFLIPIAAALGVNSTFIGKGRLPERPITSYIRELSKKGIIFNYNNIMPFAINGRLQSGIFHIEGDVSSQFITGLLFALPILEGDSKIILTSPLESKPYVDMTIDCLKNFGIEINEIENVYLVKGNQKYLPQNLTIEGDYSQAAFFFVANAIGNNVQIDNLFQKSLQGDKKIIEILNEIGYNNNNGLDCFSINATDIPDLVPILAVLGCFCNGTSKIYGAGRLKIKESDRLIAISSVLNTIGGKVTPTDDGLIIKPITEFSGGITNSFGDHRIVMSLAIAATRSTKPIIIQNADAVNKSYPSFFEDYINLGGIADVINME